MQIEDEYHSRFSGYNSLMPNRVRNILLVSTLYDAFVLEEDGSLSDQIWSQYFGMRLTEPPVVKRVSSAATALEVIRAGGIDLVLSMTRLSDGDPFAFSHEVKAIQKNLPVVLLVADPSELSLIPEFPKRSGFDYTFMWNSDPQILLAIIKLVEDKMNVDYDTKHGQVRVILMLEDSVLYYSSFLPLMYTVIMNLTRSLIDDGFNDIHKQLRMRSRAKVLLAESYEEGMELFRKYKNNVLGVISDVRYWRNGIRDAKAGFDFVRSVKKEVSDIPVVLHSADSKNRQTAFDLGANFLDKNSPSLLNDLHDFLIGQMGFGNFVFRMPNGSEVGQASNVYELLDRLRSIPIESIIWHAEHNHISNWLMARTEVTIADQLRPRRVTEFETHEEVRNLIVNTISQVLSDRQSDVVADYSPAKEYRKSSFMHAGQGSMGGKGRGIAFIRYLSKRLDLSSHFPDIEIGVPDTLIVGANEFDKFLSHNKLRKFAIECDNHREISKRFMKGQVPEDLVDSLRHYIGNNKNPLAVRSSSILEDSHLQPFAGLYSTYMLPNNLDSASGRLERLLQAVKMVWASTFGPDPKAYFTATAHRIEQEKMAVVIQELVGKAHGRLFYPTFSGVGQSYNFYPFGPMRPEEGVAHIALGLGKMVVEGGSVLRFNPTSPEVLPHLASTKDWLNNSQKQFYALQMDKGTALIGLDPNENLFLHELSQAEKDGELSDIASVYCSEDEIIRDSLSHEGPRILTFANILRYKEFPLCEILQKMHVIFSSAMGCPIEIEFAVNLWPKPRKSEFKLLQIRPLVSKHEAVNVSVCEEDAKDSWCCTSSALGNTKIEDIRDIVYVVPERFDRRELQDIAIEVGKMNRKLVKQDRPYFLIGFGRWGSSDPFLGIGVGWSDVSGAKVIAEASLSDFAVDPSNGTHFFHNITSLGVGYISIAAGSDSSHIDWKWLAAQPAEEETRYLRHVRLDKPTIIRIDGNTRRAVAEKP